MTRRRVQAYLEHGSAALRLEPDRLLSGEQTEDMLLQAVAETQGDLLLYSTTDPAQVSCYQRARAQQVSLLLKRIKWSVVPVRKATDHLLFAADKERFGMRFCIDVPEAR